MFHFIFANFNWCESNRAIWCPHNYAVQQHFVIHLLCLRKTKQFRALKQSMPVPLTQDAQLKVHTVPSGLVLHGTLVLGSIWQLGPQDAQLTTTRQQLIMGLEGERIRIVQNTRVFEYVSVLHKLIPRLGEGRRYSRIVRISKCIK